MLITLYILITYVYSSQEIFIQYLFSISTCRIITGLKFCENVTITKYNIYDDV